MSDDGAIMNHYPSNPMNCFLYFESCQFINNSIYNSSLTLNSGSEGIIFDVWGESLDFSDETKYAIHTKNCIFRG